MPIISPKGSKKTTMVQVELEPIADTKSDKEITMTKSPTKIR